MHFPYAQAASRFVSGIDRNDFAGLTLAYPTLPAHRAFTTVAVRARGGILADHTT